MPASLRVRFAPNASPLTRRDAVAETVWRNLSLDTPRPITEVPHPADLRARLDRVARDVTGLPAGAPVDQDERAPHLDGFLKSLVDLAVKVDQTLRAQADPSFLNVVDAAFGDVRTAVVVADPEQRAEYLERVDRRFHAGL